MRYLLILSVASLAACQGPVANSDSSGAGEPDAPVGRRDVERNVSGKSTVSANTTRMRSLPYVAVTTDTRRSLPEALNYGAFTEEDGCIVFIPSRTNDRFTPVLPAGTEVGFDSSGSIVLRIRNVSVTLNKEYRATGGPAPIAAVQPLKEALPDRCPKRYILLGQPSAI